MQSEQEIAGYIDPMRLRNPANPRVRDRTHAPRSSRQSDERAASRAVRGRSSNLPLRLRTDSWFAIREAHLAATTESLTTTSWENETEMRTA